MALPFVLGAWLIANWHIIATFCVAATAWLWAHRRIVVGVIVAIVMAPIVYYAGVFFLDLARGLQRVYSFQFSLFELTGGPPSDFSMYLARANYFFPAAPVLGIYLGAAILLVAVAATGYSCLALRIIVSSVGVKAISSKLFQSTRGGS
jgi:hypothetical protein